MGCAKALYIEALHAQAEQERRKARMAVSPPGLLLKRLQQAKTVHGLTPNITAPTQPVSMEKKVSATLPNNSVEGPAAVAWGLHQMAMMQPSGPDRNLILNQMDVAKMMQQLCAEFARAGKLLVLTTLGGWCMINPSDRLRVITRSLSY